MVIAMAGSGSSPEQIFQAIDQRWGIEYPATNNAVLNGGIVAASVWFGEGDFTRTLQQGIVPGAKTLDFHAADFADTDCNAANSESVVAAMHGMKALPPEAVSQLHDRIVGDKMGALQLTPPVDESISELASRTARIGESILVAHGASKDQNSIRIAVHLLYFLGCVSDLSCFCAGIAPCCSLVGGTTPLIRM